jgi:hypothetical protein
LPRSFAVEQQVTIDEHRFDEDELPQAPSGAIGMHLHVSAPPVRLPMDFTFALRDRARPFLVMEYDLLRKPVQLRCQAKITLGLGKTPAAFLSHGHKVFQAMMMRRICGAERSAAEHREKLHGIGRHADELGEHDALRVHQRFGRGNGVSAELADNPVFNRLVVGVEAEAQTTAGVKNNT